MRPWREVVKVHPAAEIFPLIPKEELRELADDIKRNGLRTKIDLYKDPKTGVEYVLDGRNRLDALTLAGKKVIDDRGRIAREFVGRVAWEGYTPAKLRAIVISQNIMRRHLTTKQRKELTKELLQLNPTTKNTDIAKRVGLDSETVRVLRKDLESVDSNFREVSKARPNTKRDFAKRKAIVDFIKANPKASKAETAKKFGIPAGSVSDYRNIVKGRNTLDPPKNVTRAHDLKARRLLKDLRSIDPAKLTDPQKFADELAGQSTRIQNKRKESA